MDDYRKKRADMIVSMIAVLTGMSERDIEKAVAGTIVYRNIMSGEECTLYDGYSANLMEIVEEVKETDVRSAVSGITPKSVSELNQWMRKCGITDALQMKEKAAEWETGEDSSAIVLRVAGILTKKLSTLETGMQNKVSNWINSGKELLKPSMEEQSVRWSNGNMALAGTRGIENKPESANDFVLYAGDGGSFKIRIFQQMNGRFVIDRPKDCGELVCLVIIGCSDTEFSEVCQLSRLGAWRMRTQELRLSAGEYRLYIPVSENQL